MVYIEIMAITFQYMYRYSFLSATCCLTSLAECLILHRLQNRELYHGLSMGILLCFPPQLSQRIKFAACIDNIHISLIHNKFMSIHTIQSTELKFLYFQGEYLTS